MVCLEFSVTKAFERLPYSGKVVLIRGAKEMDGTPSLGVSESKCSPPRALTNVLSVGWADQPAESSRALWLFRKWGPEAVGR